MPRYQISTERIAVANNVMARIAGQAHFEIRNTEKGKQLWIVSPLESRRAIVERHQTCSFLQRDGAFGWGFTISQSAACLISWIRNVPCWSLDTWKALWEWEVAAILREGGYKN